MKRFFLWALAVVAAVPLCAGGAGAFERECAVFPLYVDVGGYMHYCNGYNTSDCSDNAQDAYHVFLDELFTYDCSVNPPVNCFIGAMSRQAGAAKEGGAELPSGLHPPLTRKIPSLGEPGSVHRSLLIDADKSAKIRFTHKASERNFGKDETVYVRTLHLISKVNGRTLTIGWEYKPAAGEADPQDVSDRVTVDASQKDPAQAYLFRYKAAKDAPPILLVKYLPKPGADTQ